MKDGKIEISLRDLILYGLILALFIFVFLKFQVYQLEIGLVQRHAQITQSTQNIQILDKNIQAHDQRITALEQSKE
ncbi:MAG: hypothetical protein KAR42_16875 [candidate division Zixibacteria bacterium]|nr:hypothetical protein [candidate division Zixibacteria bacterium]